MSAARLFRKRVRTVEAIQWTGENFDELHAWGLGHISRSARGDDLRVETPSGVVFAAWGDWIVKGAPDDFYPVKRDAFAELFEPA
jgi:hypothetical protein